MKKAILFVTLLMLLVLLAACAGQAVPAPTNTPVPPATDTPVPPTNTPEAVATEAPQEEATPAPSEETALSCENPIKIGFITDLSGALAIYGNMTQRSFLAGLEYASDEADVDKGLYKVGDCEIQVFLRDDQGSADNTASLARELIDVENVDILVGTVSSGSTASMQEIAKENDVVLIVAPAAANDITGANFNDHTFRVSRENYQDFINLCQYLTTEYKTFIQIAPDYSFGYGGAQSARDACTYFGGEFVTDDIFAPLDTTDFTPYMEQILNSGAEAWIVTWAGAGFIPMFQTAAELGVLDEMGLGVAFFDNRTMAAVFSPVIDKLKGKSSGILYHYTLPGNEINDWLTEKIKAEYGSPPDLFDADGMNAALLAIDAIKATGGDASAAALIEAMEGMTFSGPKGEVYIRPEDHVAIQDMYIVKLLNLDDPDFKFYELVKTNRPEPPCLLPEDMQDRCGELPIGSLSGK